MSSLFIELYFDEDVDILVAKLIKARGFTIITARDEKLLERSDEIQLAYAVQHYRI